MSDPNFDGLCGIPMPGPLPDGTYLRCRFDLNHGGDHSWKNRERRLQIFGGITREEVVERAAKGSPAAQAILGMGQDLAPPWVLFTDKGKPKAILPAMRPGEVADVSHLTMAEAQNIVRLGNELYDALVMAKLRQIEAKFQELVALIKEKGLK